MTFTVSYLLCGSKRTAVFDSDRVFEGFRAAVTVGGDGKVCLTLYPSETVRLLRISAQMPFLFCKQDALFLNGYQSWTDSREYLVCDRMRGLRRIPRFVTQKYVLSAYGDYDFFSYSGKKGELHGYTYAYVRRAGEYFLFGSLSEREGFTRFLFDANRNTVTVCRDCEGLEINAPYTALGFAMLRGGENEVFDRWFEEMKIRRPTAEPVVGYTSWYNHYQNINEEKILTNLKAVCDSPVKFRVFQIDDGFETAVGDWLVPDLDKFPNGLSKIARLVREKGMIPGLWLAPFACEYRSKTAKEHPEWLLRDSAGNPVRGGGNWGGFYVLNFYHPAARAYIREVIETAVQKWGFGLLKLDFLYAACLCPDPAHTRGGIMCEVMDFLRECAGDALLLGCGVPLGAAFGRVDYCRIGCDVGLDYDDKPYMRLLHRERVSTKNAMRNTVFRRQLSGRAFLNDPDVFLLRDENIKLKKEERYMLAQINARFGGVLFTSDCVSSYDEEKLSLLKRITAGGEPAPFRIENQGNRYLLSVGSETFYF